MNENRALFCAFYGFFTRKRGGLRRAAFFYSLRIHYAGGKRRSEVPEKQGRDGYEMFGNVEKQRRNKEKAPIFRLVLRGGDEGDRTPYLLNAIQALSQVSYTPTGLPVSLDRLFIISNPRVKCQYPILKNLLLQNGNTDIMTFGKRIGFI